MDPLRAIPYLAALVVLATILPGATAGHEPWEVGPPDWTGMGGGDVSHEPDAADDLDASGPGLDACTPGCADPAGTLVLEGTVAQGGTPYTLALNNVLREATAEAPEVDHQDHIYPGENYAVAWWGWWHDKGRGDYLRGESPSTLPGLVGPEADGTINDGHDDHASNGDTIYTGPWDEFVWRGKNPWAGQQQWDPKLGDKSSRPGDSLYTFVHPGTHKDWQAQVFFGAILSGEADHPEAADFALDDKTDRDRSSYGYPHGNQAFGWVQHFSTWHYQYDQSFLMTTSVKFSANPTPTDAGGNTFDPDTGDRVDTDLYASIHPAVETVYRTAVWDPGNHEHPPGDTVIHDDGEGLKARLKAEYARSEVTAAEAQETVYQALGPIDPAVGLADDAAGAKPRPHEPDHPDDDYNGHAVHDGDKAYGRFSGGSDAYYENPDADQDYLGYKDGYAPWMDTFLWQEVGPGNGVFFDRYLFPSAQDGAERTAPPASYSLLSFLGAWWDENGDNWVGDLGELGRPTAPDSPYADGRVQEPNDYGDHPEATEGADDAIKAPPAEWVREDSAKHAVTATVRPVGTPQNGEGQHAWGTTQPPAGVYVTKDKVAPDTCGCDTRPVSENDDGEQASNYVQYGPIDVDLRPGRPGVFWTNEQFVFPTGSLDYTIRIESVGTLSDDKFENLKGRDLTGQSVRDVDLRHPSRIG